jgi:hypothetical protein
MVEAMAAGALMAHKGLMKGKSPGVRASGPFQKQINQANAAAMSAKMRNQSMSGGMKVAGKALGSAFGKARR